MELKKRTPSLELQIFNSLSPRFPLSEKDKKNHYTLRKGYEGELTFDQHLDDQLQSNCFIIKDLRLTIDENTFQIDTIIIFPSLIEFFEIKNFEGEYLYDPQHEKFYKYPNYEIQNPEHQMSRAETLLQKLLFKYNVNLKLNGSVVFVNPEFTLFNAPANKPFYLPTQIPTLMRTLNNHQGDLTNRHLALAKKLISLHEENYPPKKIPVYHYHQLAKGIRCSQCNSLSAFVKGQYCYCQACGAKEKCKDAIIRSIHEYKLLFPENKITKGIIYDWCGGIMSEQRIKRTLGENFHLIRQSRTSYYEIPTTNE